METEGRIIFTFRIFTEEPGHHIIQCLNIPDIVIPCNEIKQCIDQCRAHLEFLISVEKTGLINDYTPADFVDDGWHFQFIYNKQNLTYVNIYPGRILRQSQ